MISTAEFLTMQARCNSGRREAVPAEGVENEGDLHDQILAQCRHRLWPVIHSRMDMATTTATGAPDFVIFADAGRVFAVESKTKTGKQTPQQIAWQMLMERNGHRYAIVRSMVEFLDLVKTP